MIEHRKTRAMKSCDNQDVAERGRFRKVPFLKCSPSTLIRLAGVCKFFQSGERFREGPFSMENFSGSVRISVDGIEGVTGKTNLSKGPQTNFKTEQDVELFAIVNSIRPVQTSCYCRAKLAQTSNSIQSNRTRLLPKIKYNNKETVQQTFKCILMHL